MALTMSIDSVRTYSGASGMAFAPPFIMYSPVTRKLTNLSRFCGAATALVLAACTHQAPADTRSAVYAGQAMPGVQVENIDQALAQFMGDTGASLILLPNRLDRSRLDYSIESLKLIDRWLADIHTINRLQAETGGVGEILTFDGRGDNSVIFAGLYLGEVIRAHSKLDWQWQRFDTFLQANPVYTEHYGHAPGLDQFVLVGPQGATTPINAALKRVIHGKEESVHFIATFLMTEVDLDAAMSGRDLMGLDRRDAVIR